MRIIAFEPPVGKYTIAEDTTMLSCSLIKGVAVLSIERTMLLNAKSDGTYTALTDDVSFVNIIIPRIDYHTMFNEGMGGFYLRSSFESERKASYYWYCFVMTLVATNQRNGTSSYSEHSQ